MLLALALRLWRIDLNRFYYDQVWLLRSANDFLDSGRLPLHGGIPLSIGVWLPPLVSYLLAVPSLISRDPVWISACMAALDSLGALFVYVAARRLKLSGAGSLAAAVAYAVSPAGILFGRMIWNVNFVPLLAAVALCGLVDFLTSRRPLPLAASLLAVGWAAQLHLVASVYGVLWLAVAIYSRRDLRWPWVAGAAALVLLPLVPYVVYEAQGGWADLALLRQFLAQPSHTDLVAFERAAALAGPAIFWRMLPDGHAALWAGFDPLTWLLAAITVAGAAFALARRRAEHALVVAWLALPILLSLRHSVDVTTWYLLGGIPAMALLQGLCVEGAVVLTVARRMPRPSQARTTAVGALTLALVAAVGGSYASFQDQLANATQPDEYDIPLGYSMAAARQLSPADRVFLAVPTLQGDVIPYLAGLRSYRAFSGSSVVVMPPEGGTYVAQSSTAAGRYLRDRFGPPAGTVSTPNGQPEFHLLRVPAAGGILTSAGFTALAGQVGDVIRLEGYRTGPLAAGQPSRVELIFRVVDAAKLAQLRFSQFAHLVDAQGRIWSHNTDSYNVLEQWQDGDLAVWPADLDVAPDAPLGGYWIDAGFYNSFSREPLPIAQDGKPAANSIRIGPLRVAGSEPAAGSPLAVFGQDELSLTGVHWNGNAVALDWLASTKPKGDYTVFVHALDAAGKLVAQHDGLPAAGSYPTSLWQPGDRVEDLHPLGQPAAPGLRLEVGLYTQPELRRLPVTAPGQSTPADSIVVTPDA